MYQTYLHHTCETDLLLSPTQLPDTCHIAMVNLKHVFFHPLDLATSWIFVSPEPQNIQVLCHKTNPSGNITYPLTGTEVITLRPDCKAFLPGITLKPQFPAGTSNYHHPNLNYPTVNFADIPNLTISSSAFPKIPLPALRLDQLKEEKSRLLRNELQAENLYHTSLLPLHALGIYDMVTHIVFAYLILYANYKLARCMYIKYKSRRQTPNTATPRPVLPQVLYTPILNNPRPPPYTPTTEPTLYPPFPTVAV